MKLRNALVLACFAIAACGGDDDPTGPTGASGSLSFSYQGGGATNTATYSASGTIPSTVGGEISGSLGTSAWAAGAFSSAQNYAVIGASVPKTSTSWDVTEIVVNRTTVGTNPISSDCNDPEVTTCTGVFVLFNFNPNGDSSSAICFLTTGSVTVSAISASNITGTFSGTGSCFNGTTGAESPFSITNGTFNVGVTSQLLL